MYKLKFCCQFTEFSLFFNYNKILWGVNMGCAGPYLHACAFMQKITNLMLTFQSIGMKSKNKIEKKKLTVTNPRRNPNQQGLTLVWGTSTWLTKFHFWLQWTWSTTSIPLNHDNYLVFEIVVSHLGGFCIDVLINNKVFPGS